MRRRFELADGATRKFWEIETVEDTYVTWRGIVGEAGIEVREQTRSSRYCAEFDGSRRTEAAIYRKLRRGYVEVYGEAPLVEPPNAPHDPDGPRAGLELELSARPEDYDRWSIYADTLASAGDPRGELVAIGVALARGHEDGRALEVLVHRTEQMLPSIGDDEADEQAA